MVQYHSVQKAWHHDIGYAALQGLTCNGPEHTQLWLFFCWNWICIYKFFNLEDQDSLSIGNQMKVAALLQSAWGFSGDHNIFTQKTTSMCSLHAFYSPRMCSLGSPVRGHTHLLFRTITSNAHHPHGLVHHLTRLLSRTAPFQAFPNLHLRASHQHWFIQSFIAIKLFSTATRYAM